MKALNSNEPSTIRAKLEPLRAKVRQARAKAEQNRAKLEHAMFILSTPSSPSHTYTQPSSVHHRSSGLAMAETEFRDSERITLLTALQKTLNANVPSTIWANLWLSHI